MPDRNRFPAYSHLYVPFPLFNMTDSDYLYVYILLICSLFQLFSEYFHDCISDTGHVFRVFRSWKQQLHYESSIKITRPATAPLNVNSNQIFWVQFWHGLMGRPSEKTLLNYNFLEHALILCFNKPVRRS
jgi:hypothetical protein